MRFKTIFFFSIVLLAFIPKVKAQNFIIASNPAEIYVDIIPDTLLDPPISNGSHNMVYQLDINQDTFDDIEVLATGNSSSGTYNWYIKVSALDTNTTFSLGEVDSTYVSSSSGSCGAYWFVRPILKIYNIGDTIQNSDYISSGYLGYRNNVALCQVDIWNTDWVNIGDVFFGVRYKTASDTLYAWVEVNVTQVQRVLIKEFSLDTPNTVTNVNLTKKPKKILLYPNPANDVLHIENIMEESIIELRDVTGKLILRKNINAAEAIDISMLAPGIYNVYVNNSRQSINNRLIIIK